MQATWEKILSGDLSAAELAQDARRDQSTVCRRQHAQERRAAQGAGHDAMNAERLTLHLTHFQGAGMVKAKKKRAAAPVALRAEVDTDDLLQRLQLSLEDMQRQLLNVDAVALSNDDHETWRRQLNAVSLAITKVRNARLAALSAEISAQLPALERATDQLAESLARLRAADEIIRTVAEGIGVITQVLTLFA
jgi:hypothetical protein